MLESISYSALTIFYICFVATVLPYILQMFQQNRYEVYRLSKWALEQKKSFVPMILSSLIAFGLAYVLSHQFSPHIASIVLIWYFVIVLGFYIIRQNKKKSIKPLVLTWRVRRQILVLIILNAIVFFTITLNLPHYWFYLAVVCWPLQWVLMLLTAWITAPIEAMVRNQFKQKAKKELNDIHPITIGITGSFGKTSAKTILRDVLSQKYITLMTPGSFNTPMGITRTIREYLKPIHQVFICEMGADHVGDIKELMNFVTPKYGLVTSIGEQHLNTFRSLKNIINEKMKEIEMLPSDGVGFLNLDNEYIRNYEIQNNCKTVSFAIDYPADYQAINITYSNEGSTFEVAHDGVAYPFKTRLLGKNNVSNILAAVAIARELGLSWTQIIHAVAGVQAVEHRLQKRIINGYTFIDNAFNSNPVGAATSLEVMQQMNGQRIIVTPGFIDMGSKQDYYNHTFGTQMKDHVDWVILVGPTQTKAIYDGLKESGFDMDHVLVVKNVDEAFTYVYTHFTRNDTILLENDLPDAFSY